MIPAIAAGLLVLGVIVVPFALYARAAALNHAPLRADKLEHPRDYLEG